MKFWVVWRVFAFCASGLFTIKRKIQTEQEDLRVSEPGTVLNSITVVSFEFWNCKMDPRTKIFIFMNCSQQANYSLQCTKCPIFWFTWRCWCGFRLLEESLSFFFKTQRTKDAVFSLTIYFTGSSWFSDKGEYSCLIRTLGLMINAVVGYYFYSSVQNPGDLIDSGGLHYLNKASCPASVVCLLKWFDQTVSEVPAVPIPETIWLLRDSSPHCDF